MSLNKNVICFKHCSSASIFCKKVPIKCPLCDNLLLTFVLEPFVLPYPLVNAKDFTCSIIVRPSVGDFLDSYNVTDDLHIGITNSTGDIIEYDKCGLVQNDNNKWRDCIAVRFIPDSWEMFWDELFMDMNNDLTWNPINYNDNSFNCFNFVLSFLKKLKYNELQLMNKEDICEMFILPKIENVLKYALLHKHLKNKEIYIQE